MKRKFKQWWSSILPRSTKRTITSHHNWTHWTQNRPRHMTLEIQILALDKHKNVMRLNRLIGSQPPLLITERKFITADYLHMEYNYVLTNSASIW